MPKTITLLGSTGSIGTQSLDVARMHGYRIFGLAANSRVEILQRQIEEFHPEYVAVVDPAACEKLDAALAGTANAPKLLKGPEGLRTLAAMDGPDVVLNAVVGIAGLPASLAAIESGHDLALANKESLVTGGHLVTDAVKKYGVKLLPVDSEHSAIFQCLQDQHSAKRLEKILLTASGGPFFGMTTEQLRGKTKSDALKHPNWNMGAQITVDSGTLMNKALELIEACQLYGLSEEKVRVLVHPQSIVHSLVAFRDGSQLAQLGVPDMRLPIGACLLWPRVESPLVAPLDLAAVGTLTFENVDDEAFPALTLARRALRVRSGMCVVLNGADEEAVALFLGGKCRFTDITAAVAHAMDEHLTEMRRTGGMGQGEPFSLYGRIPSLTGRALEEAAWRQLGRISELDAGARSAVREYVTGGGARTC